jgi:hypothetical protein
MVNIKSNQSVEDAMPHFGTTDFQGEAAQSSHFRAAKSFTHVLIPRPSPRGFEGLMYFVLLAQHPVDDKSWTSSSKLLPEDLW